MPREKLWTKDFLLGTAVNFLLMVNYYGLMVVIADFAMRTYGAPASTAGLAASIFIIGALAARFASGGLMDRIGRKRMLVAGAAVEVVLSALYLANLGFLPLFAIRLVHGAAYGMCSTAIGTIVTGLVPPERKGEGVGYYMLSVTLGAAIGPFLGMVLSQNAGFSAIFAAAAGVAVLCLLAVLQLDNGEADAAGGKAAESVEAAEAAEVTGAAGAAGATAAAQTVEEAENGHGNGSAPRQDRRRHLVQGGGRFSIFDYLEPSVLPISAVCALLFFCYSSLLTFLTPFSQESGLETAASLFFVVYAAATFATRPFTGRLFDRRGDRVVMVPAFIAFVAGMALLATAHSAPALLAAAALLGFGVGTVQASGLALAVRIAPDSRLGLANSTFYILLDIGVGIGPLALGIVQPLWGYRGLFAAMAGVALAAMAAYLLVSRRGGHMRALLGKNRGAR